MKFFYMEGARNMTEDSYKILYAGGEHEIVVKKSRFIATTKPVASEEEATAFIAQVKKKYWDAGHHCQAFTIGRKHELTRCSDDGEPAQTAGRPMLDVLLGEDIHNACVVVTRYFGGTLLGTGGLVRAYSQAAKEGLVASRVAQKCRGFLTEVQTGYTNVGKIQYILGQEGVTVLETLYTDTVKFRLLVPAGDYAGLEKKLIEGTGATAAIEKGGESWYGLIKDRDTGETEVVLF